MPYRPRPTSRQKEVEEEAGKGKGDEKGPAVEFDRARTQADMAALFRRLDPQGRGFVELESLAAVLEQLDIPHCSAGLQDIFTDGKNRENKPKMTLDDFVQYMVDHQEKLHIAFHETDQNKDVLFSHDIDFFPWNSTLDTGYLSVDELVSAFKKIGIALSDEEATELAKSLRTKEGEELFLTFDEWKELMLFHRLPTGGSSSTGYRHKSCFFSNLTKVVDLGMGEVTNPPDYLLREAVDEEEWSEQLAMAVLVGTATRTFTAPLTRTKVFFQVYPREASIGVVSCMFDQIGEGGVRSFWRGNLLNCLKIGPEVYLKFHAYDRVRRALYAADDQQQGHQAPLMGRSVREMTAGDHTFVACASSLLAQTFIYPFEVLSTRGHLKRTGHFDGYVDAALRIRRREGIRAFYRGYLANLAAVIPYSGIEVLTFNVMRQMHESRTKTVALSRENLMVYGAVSTGAGMLAVYPFLHVRTILQTRGLEGTLGYNLAEQLSRDPGIRDVFRALTRTGFLPLYRGIVPCLLKTYPVAAITYVLFDGVDRLRHSWAKYWKSHGDNGAPTNVSKS